jgi:hypothetical protein
MGLDTKTYWLTDRQSQCNFDLKPVILETEELLEWRSSLEAGSPRQPEAEIAVPGGSVGAEQAPSVASRFIAAPN